MVASGVPNLGYQWYGPNGILTDGGRVTGGTTSNLTVTGMATPDAGNYYVVVSNYYGSVTSSEAGIRIVAWQAPRILVEPPPQTLNAGQALSLWVSATGSQPLSYQWYGEAGALADGGRLSGATTTNLGLALLESADAGNYYVVISNSYGNATSAVVSVRVETGQAPRILAQPQGQILNAGQPLSLWLTASGEGTLTYFWHGPSGLLSNDGRVGGAATTNLTISTVEAGDASDY